MKAFLSAFGGVFGDGRRMGLENHFVKRVEVKNDSLKAIADRARLARKALKLSQTQVHAAGGPSRPTLYRIENALAVESLESQLQRLGLVLAVRPEWLIKGDGPMKAEGAEEAAVPYQAESGLDLPALTLAIETLEAFLAQHHKKLAPAAKAQTVAQLYATMRLWRPEALTAANVTPLLAGLLAG